MAKKLGRNEYPSGHGPDDFKVHGPPATKDGEFAGTCIADMGCFMQEEVDSNKYYHACVCESKKDGTFYLYVEYGRVGAANPQKQFTQCSSKAEAEREYVSQCESKNVKRGTWENHATLGQRLIPKLDSKGKPKDLYIVRPLATRDTGLPDAKTISCNEGAKQKPTKTLRSKKKTVDTDKQTMKLMSDLNVAAVSYTRSSIVGNAIPTQTALDRGRDILTAALERVKDVGDNTDDQVNDKELKQLTRDMYGIIPKIKDRNASADTWILSSGNIGLWQQDIDAFESALYATDLGDQIESDPFGGMAIKMNWIDPKSEQGQFIYEWWPGATRNRHGWVGAMKIKNAWFVERKGDAEKVAKVQAAYGNVGKCERPLHQPVRSDLDRDGQKLFTRTNTALLFHGTRSVNVSGILRESLRLPKQLVGVVITGAMFGGGLYWADDWKKSAGYTSLRGSYWSGGQGEVRGRSAFMFAADVVLGKPFVAPGPRGYTGPPSGHQSVLGKAGVSQVQNNEFITYERESHRLRYLIEFDA